MGGVAVRRGIEVDLGAAEAAGLLEHPVEQAGGVAAAPMGFQRDEIVDVEDVAPGERVEAAEPGGRRRERPGVVTGEGGDEPYPSGRWKWST